MKICDNCRYYEDGMCHHAGDCRVRPYKLACKYYKEEEAEGYEKLYISFTSVGTPSSVFVVPEDGTEACYVRQDYSDQLVASAALNEKEATIDKACEWLLDNESRLYWDVESPSCTPCLKKAAEALRRYLGGEV